MQILLKEGRSSFLKKLELVMLVSIEEEQIYPSFFSTKSADEDELHSSPINIGCLFVDNVPGSHY
jgi:hypothetical protein